MSNFDSTISGSFTTPASGNGTQILQLPYIPDVFEIWIQGNSSGDNWINTSGNVTYAVWQRGMSDGTALTFSSSTGPATVPKFLATGGITPIRSVSNLYGPAQAGSGITKANPAVMTLTNSSVYNTGDVVLLESTTGAFQFSGIPWSVVSTGATTYNLGISGTTFSASPFANAATNVVARKVLYPFGMTPYLSYIVALSLGATTTVTTSFPHGLSVGDTIRLVIPSQWGTVQISGQQGIVTAVANTIQFTVAINSSNATAFAFPTSAQAAAGVTWPQVIPFGDQASAFDLSATDNNYLGLMIGNSSSAGAAILNENSALCVWRAQKSEKVYVSLTA